MAKQKKDISIDNLKTEYQNLYKIILEALKDFHISIDESYYNYLRKEYDLTDCLYIIFGTVNQEFTFDFIINMILATILTDDFYQLINRNPPLYNKIEIGLLIHSTFYLHEFEFLQLVNKEWKNDLNEYGEIKDKTFNIYKSLTNNDKQKKK